MNTTLCWRGNHVYPITDEVCPVCNAANANVDWEKASAEIAHDFGLPPKADHPTRSAIIGCIAAHFGVNESVALDWILAEFRGDIEFAARREAA